MKQIVKTLFLAGITSFIAFSLIKYPDQALEASLRGLDIWWEIVFPTLLPFFIVAELLIGFGVVKFIGVLFEPIMRPLFNVPGVGSFAWAMGMASGYPTGAKITAHLREENQLTKTEAERLVSFTNASSPLFIFGAVSVGFFYDAKLGVLLAVCHYLGNALVGICMRFYGRKHDDKHRHSHPSSPSPIKAFREMHWTRLNDKRPLGQIVGDAVLNSIKTLVMVGGFIILFSVFTKLLFIVNITPIIAAGLGYILHLLYLPINLAMPVISGLFELTLGVKGVAQIDTDSLLAKMIVVSFILGFNGFSVQAQVASIIAKTDIRFSPYFFARLLHGTFASILTILLYKPLYLNRQAFDMNEHPVFSHGQEGFWEHSLAILNITGPLITIIFLTIGVWLGYRRLKKE